GEAARAQRVREVPHRARPALRERLRPCARRDQAAQRGHDDGRAAQGKDGAPFRRWLAALPAKEKDAWLMRAADEPELGLGGELLRAFRATTKAEHHGTRRTVRELRALAAARRAD